MLTMAFRTGEVIAISFIMYTFLKFLIYSFKLIRGKSFISTMTVEASPQRLKFQIRLVWIGTVLVGMTIGAIKSFMDSIGQRKGVEDIVGIHQSFFNFSDYIILKRIDLIRVTF
jgi:hypothetical protein